MLKTAFCLLKLYYCVPRTSELTSLLEANDKESVLFQQWLTTDRCNLETITKTIDEFVPYFVEKVDKLITHDFIYKEQSSFLRDKKESLKQGEVLTICDFSENYSFIIQNSAQGYHWNNSQATIHPFEVYYRKENKLENLSFIIISEVLTHDTTAVQLFISKLLDFIKQSIDFSKITFMSDGAAAHYKNKKKLPVCAVFGPIMDWKQNGTSSQLHMAKVHVTLLEVLSSEWQNEQVLLEIMETQSQLLENCMTGQLNSQIYI